jgi:hypothetical protein
MLDHLCFHHFRAELPAKRVKASAMLDNDDE